MIRPTKVLCKKTYNNGYVNGHMFLTYWKSNTILTKDKWYDVIYNINDLSDTFTIIDDEGDQHLFYIFDGETKITNKDKMSSEWFYTLSELRDKKLNTLLL